MSWGTMWSLHDLAHEAEHIRDIKEVRNGDTSDAKWYSDELAELKNNAPVDWTMFKDAECAFCGEKNSLFISPRKHEDCISHIECETTLSVLCDNCHSMYSDHETDMFLATKGVMRLTLRDGRLYVHNVGEVSLKLDDGTIICGSVKEEDGEAKVELSLGAIKTVFDRECFDELDEWLFPELRWKLARLENQLRERN